MKVIGSELDAHLNEPCTTLAVLWKVTRMDGAIMGFTTHDEDLVYSGLTYQGATGMLNSSVKSASDMSVDNMEISAFLDAESITLQDIRAGLYDNASIEVRLVNWADLTQNDLKYRKGNLGQLSVNKPAVDVFTAEIRGLNQKLSTVIGSVYGPTCRAELGSGTNGIDMNNKWLCHVDIVALQESSSVSSSADLSTIVPISGLTSTSGYFDNGLLIFTSGELEDFKFEVKSWDGTTLRLFLPMPFAPANGDTFTVEPGCNKTVDDCKNKFNNVINFRGEPFIPGLNVVMNYPDAKN